ncbi:MAG: hypothetical protein AAGI46_04570 [Planctomycetota bacterium]
MTHTYDHLTHYIDLDLAGEYRDELFYALGILHDMPNEQGAIWTVINRLEGGGGHEICGTNADNINAAVVEAWNRLAIADGRAYTNDLRTNVRTLCEELVVEK